MPLPKVMQLHRSNDYRMIPKQTDFRVPVIFRKSLKKYAPMLDREEYIEQAYLFRVFVERIAAGISSQERSGDWSGGVGDVKTSYGNRLSGGGIEAGWNNVNGDESVGPLFFPVSNIRNVPRRRGRRTFRHAHRSESA